MTITNLASILKWGFLAIYSFFAYHLLLTPLLLEYSLIGAAVGWGVLLALFFIIPKQHRKQAAIFILLAVFATKALHNVGDIVSFTRILSFIFVTVVVYLVGRFYGKLSNLVMGTLLSVAILIYLIVPQDELRMFSHFSKVWESPSLYTGSAVDYFPLLVRDIDGDGQHEVLTFGNRDEESLLYEERLAKGLDPNRMPYDVQEEPLFLYVFKWNGTEMERIDNENLNIEDIRPFLPKDYIGFPYYVLQDDFTLVPQIQKQTLAEQMGQFGAAPFHVMNLNIGALSEYVGSLDGIYDKVDDFRFETDIKDITIVQGQLIISYADKEITVPTRATKVIDLVRTDNGLGVLLLSDKLELWTFNENNEIELTHILTENEISNIMSSEYLVADIQHDGTDEILISAVTSRIIRPGTDGEWDILFTSPNKSLRFEDFATIGSDETPHIIALSKSRVRNNPLRFLTGFTYTDEGLKQEWKAFNSLINVQAVDITGNDESEIVATIWRSHKVYVFQKHELPVQAGLGAGFVLLVLYTVYRRVRNHA